MNKYLFYFYCFFVFISSFLLSFTQHPYSYFLFIVAALIGAQVKTQEKDYLSGGIETKMTWIIKAFPVAIAGILLGLVGEFLRGRFLSP